jgi:hypothetical protein
VFEMGLERTNNGKGTTAKVTGEGVHPTSQNRDVGHPEIGSGLRRTGNGKSNCNGKNKIRSFDSASRDETARVFAQDDHLCGEGWKGQTATTAKARLSSNPLMTN